MLEKKNNMIQCCVWHYLQGFWVNPIGEMGQTGQHDQVLEEGTDPNLGCFCPFLDVLLDFWPSQTPLRQNGDKDLVLTSWESRSTATEWTCRNWQFLPWVLVLTVFGGLEPLGKALWGARKDSCIVSKQRRRVSSPDWGSKMRKRENESQRLLWKIIVLGGGAITSCHEHVFQGQSVSMTYNSHLSSICQLSEITFPPCGTPVRVQPSADPYGAKCSCEIIYQPANWLEQNDIVGFSGSTLQKLYNVTEMLYGCSRKKKKIEAILETKLNPPK